MVNARPPKTNSSFTNKFNLLQKYAKKLQLTMADSLIIKVIHFDLEINAQILQKESTLISEIPIMPTRLLVFRGICDFSEDLLSDFESV